MSRLCDYWAALENKSVQCELCPHRCKIEKGSFGLCSTRKNHEGKLIATGYGRASAIALDPVEKKPLYMYKQGKNILSIGGFGCNLHCPFCQNYEISLQPDERQKIAKIIDPEEVIILAKETRNEGNIGIAYTYNEPLVGYEFVRDIAELAYESKLNNVLVTNGYINPEPLEALLPVIDAMNIDLKSFSDDFYKKVGGDLESVKNTIELSYKHCHIEITTLIIPGENEDTITELAKWLSSINPEIPLHLSRFFPRYKYADRSPTSQDVIYNLQDKAKKYLKHVFTGNM